MNKYLARLTALAIGMGITLTTGTAASASDSVPYTLSFTAGLGAHPRSTPAYEARTGSALPEGSVVNGACWLYGEDITNYYDYTSGIWIRDTSGHYWPEAWLDTGSEGIPHDLSSCDPGGAASDTESWQPNCTPDGDYILGDIVVTDTGEGSRISVTPTSSARNAWGNGVGWDSTVSMWHSIQDCVPGLYDATADSVWQQLECHQRFATAPGIGETYATGDTYDLETWTDPFAAPNDLAYVLSRCLNGEVDQYFASLRLFAITD